VIESVFPWLTPSMISISPLFGQLGPRSQKAGQVPQVPPGMWAIWLVGSLSTYSTQDFVESGSWLEFLVTLSFPENRSSGCVIEPDKPMFGFMLISRHNGIACRKVFGAAERDAGLKA
jgi:hypothetical protein